MEESFDAYERRIEEEPDFLARCKYLGLGRSFARSPDAARKIKADRQNEGGNKEHRDHDEFHSGIYGQGP